MSEVSMPTITLVCGPPCGGKSTHVRQHAHPSDHVICHDTLARAAGSRATWNHSRAHNDAARHAWRAETGYLAGHGPDRDTWVIRCAANADERQTLARRLGAHTVIVAMPPLDVALRRARAARRGGRVEQVIRRWYASYRPAAGEHVVDTSRATPLPTW